MNGAIAEPWVAISSAPNNAMVINIGASQNFLRTRKKDQNSTTKLPIRSLSNRFAEALSDLRANGEDLERAGGWYSRVTRLPV
jgi:hypothetical protein